MNNLSYAIEYAKSQKHISRKNEKERIKKAWEEEKRKKEEQALMLQEKNRERIKKEIREDGTLNIFDVKNEQLLDIIIENPKFYVLRKRTHFCDLHEKNILEAVRKVTSIAHSIAKSDVLKCVGFIHGRGLHSNYYNDFDYDFDDFDDDFDDFDDFYDDFDDFYDGGMPLRPVLKPIIRDKLDYLADKLKCKSIYGEDLFSTVDSHKNNGITYFMNMQFYDYFNDSNINWNYEKFRLFQEINEYNSIGYNNSNNL